MATTNPAEDATTQAAPIPYPFDTPQKVATPGHRARRQWLKGAIGTAIIAALSYFGWTKYLFPPSSATAAPAGPLGKALGKVASFPAGGSPTLLESGPYLVENLGGGAFRVLSAKCTHQGCTVGWDATHSQFLCPCHGGRFDLTGRNIVGPPAIPLPTLKSQVQGDTLYIEG